MLPWRNMFHGPEDNLDKLNVRLTKLFFVKFITSSRCLNKTVDVPLSRDEVIMI